MTPGRPPVAVSVAGSDPSGGAGIQADLKTFGALGAYGCAVVTALTAQNTTSVVGVHPVPVDVVLQQLDVLLADVRVDAVKVGMLGTAELTRALAPRLGRLSKAGVPVVVDPVMTATTGARLLDREGAEAFRELLPLVDVITPNLLEAEVLSGQQLGRGIGALSGQARLLRQAGARRVLVTGGHLDGHPDAVDLWSDDDGEQRLTAERLPDAHTHGTGCTLSSALAALRPRCPDWHATVTQAKAWLTEAIRQAPVLEVGRGVGPLHHFHEFPRWR